MKEKYEKAKTEIVEFEVKEILTTVSGPIELPEQGIE